MTIIYTEQEILKYTQLCVLLTDHTSLLEYQKQDAYSYEDLISFQTIFAMLTTISSLELQNRPATFDTMMQLLRNATQAIMQSYGGEQFGQGKQFEEKIESSLRPEADYLIGLMIDNNFIEILKDKPQISFNVSKKGKGMLSVWNMLKMRDSIYATTMN